MTCVPLPLAEDDFLFAAGSEFHFCNARGAHERGAGGAGAAEHFLVEHGAVELVGGKPRLVAAADLAGLVERFHVAVREPETHPLFHEMLVVQVLSHAEHTAQKPCADLDGGFADATRELPRFFKDQDADAGILP